MSHQDFEQMTLPELRTLFCYFRNKTKRLSGCDYSNLDFSNDVSTIIKNQELDPTPINVVSCANEVYNNSVLNDWYASEKDVS